MKKFSVIFTLVGVFMIMTISDAYSQQCGRSRRNNVSFNVNVGPRLPRLPRLPRIAYTPNFYGQQNACRPRRNACRPRRNVCTPRRHFISGFYQRQTCGSMSWTPGYYSNVVDGRVWIPERWNQNACGSWFAEPGYWYYVN